MAVPVIDEFAKILDPIRLTRMAVPVMEESSRMPALPASATASMAFKSDFIYCRAFRGAGFQGSRFKVQGSEFSAAAGLKSGQSNRKRNSEKANNEYRTRNNEYRSKVFYLS